MAVGKVLLLENRVEFGIRESWMQRSVLDAGNSDGQGTALSGGSDGVFRNGGASQSGLNQAGQQFFERHTLLNGAGFHFFEKRVGKIESCSHGQSVAQICENVKMRLCQL